MITTMISSVYDAELGSGVAVHQVKVDHLTQRDFARLAKFIEQTCGIKMPPSKMTMLEGRLRKRLGPTGQPNLKKYCDFLFDLDGLAVESVHLIDAVTTNKTDFFREPEHFRVLVDRILPEIMANGRPIIKVWSAACSIGAEPYTLAMLLADQAQRLAGLRFSIFATDICTEALHEAVQGIYPESMMAPVPPPLRTRYVMRAKNPARGLVRIAPELRAAVQFGHLNLMAPTYPLDRDMDVIFVRNILIYFDKATQQSVLSRLCDHLRPGGYLFLGHSETPAGLELPIDLAGPNTFRRR